MNDLTNQSFARKNAVWLIVLAAVIVFGLLLSKGWDQVVNNEIDSTSTITGNFSCLPYKEGVAGTDCSLGVRAQDGSYYALDISRIQDANTDLKVEDTVAVTGFVLPQSAVAGSIWEDFDVAGIIKVNTLLRTR
jgi:hypothetical protein